MDPVLIVVLIVVAILLGGAGYVFLRGRSKSAKGEDYYHFNCPGCRRKLRYRSRQAGHAGACPRCNKSFTFPIMPQN